MLVPHGEGPSRSLSVSMAAVRIVAGIAIVLAATFLAGVLGIASKTVDVAQSGRLANENRALASELGRMDARISALSDTLAVITRRDEEIRLVAGLEPLDPDVRRAGVGGPGSAVPARDELAAGGRTGREAVRIGMDLDGLIRRANLLSASVREAGDSLQSHAQRLSATPSIMPTEGFLTSNFSRLRFHPILLYDRPHEGLDITAPYGSPVIAPGAGRVTRVEWSTGYGLTVEVEHGYGIVTRYAHLSRTAVAIGQMLRRGDRIGFVGSTGLSRGPHLHYEVLVNGSPVDPRQYILPDAIAD